MEPNEIRLLRVTSGLTRKEAATLLGCTDRTVYYWETGRRKPLRKSVRPLQERARQVKELEAAAALSDWKRNAAKRIRKRDQGLKQLPALADNPTNSPITGAIPVKPISLYDQLDKEG